MQYVPIATDDETRCCVARLTRSFLLIDQQQEQFTIQRMVPIRPKQQMRPPALLPAELDAGHAAAPAWARREPGWEPDSPQSLERNG